MGLDLQVSAYMCELMSFVTMSRLGHICHWIFVCIYVNLGSNDGVLLIIAWVLSTLLRTLDIEVCMLYCCYMHGQCYLREVFLSFYHAITIVTESIKWYDVYHAGCYSCCEICSVVAISKLNTPVPLLGVSDPYLISTFFGINIKFRSQSSL